MAVESQRIISHSNFLFFVMSLSPNQMRDRLPLTFLVRDSPREIDEVTVPRGADKLMYTLRMIVLFKILTLFRFKAIRSSSLTLNEIMIALIANRTQGYSWKMREYLSPFKFRLPLIFALEGGGRKLKGANCGKIWRGKN